MPRLGAHMSVAGGLPRAVERAILHGCAAFQIFAKNANQWRGRVVPREEVREFRAKLETSGLGPPPRSHPRLFYNVSPKLPSATLRWEETWRSIPAWIAEPNATFKLVIGDALEFASIANDRTGWSQIAATVESCVRDLVAQSRTA